MPRKIVVTSALPYANGAIHIGHLVEYLQTDFWVRFQKMRGNECVYICADDTHGTPIMIRARQEGVSPESIIEKSYAAHTKDFADFEVAFDNYHTTNCDENRTFSNAIFAAMERGGYVTSTPIQQFYCEHDNMFLPDRFVKGTCPKCGASNQYGDSCDTCAATYGADELKDPACSICGKPPVKRDSEQLFFELEPFRDFLKEWIPAHTASDVSNKLLEWFNEPLRGWNISRDAPYFGFEIPGHPGKYFYVWMDAPIGYMASLQNWCTQHGHDFAQYWENPQAELYHFIGKDIVRFHSLFWPAMLHCAGHKTPDQIFVHGFLTVNGEKMSKSKGTFVSARTYLDHLPAYYLRFYYACKLNGTTDDMDLNLEDFVNRVNSDLVGKITNLASRGAQMLHKNFSGQATTLEPDGAALLQRFRGQSDDIAAAYENRDFCRVMVLLREMADEANQYFDAQTPWALVKTDPAKAQQVLTATLNHFRYFAIVLKPILPAYAQQAEALFGEQPWTWDTLATDWQARTVAPYTYLATRVDPVAVEAMVADSKPKEAPAVTLGTPIKATIDYDTFDKTDLRVAKILTAEAVEGSDKLLKVAADIGEAQPRQILAGIKSAYKPEDLVGKHVVIVANLAPRKMRFGISEGMILAASDATGKLYTIHPDTGATPGNTVK